MRICARAVATMAVAVTMAVSSPLHAQAVEAGHETPKLELSVDYSHFGVGVGNTEGTNGNRMVGLNGGSASLALNFNRFVGIAGDVGGYDANKLELVGTGANQPRVVGASGTAFTFLVGPRISLRNGTRFTPFMQVLAGGVHASPVTVKDCSGSACTPLPAQTAFAMTAGGGLDLGLTRVFALRLVQAEYMMTRFGSVPGGVSGSQMDLRLSTGILLRFDGASERQPLQLACSVQPQSGFAGDPMVASATAMNLSPKHSAVYAWTSTGGVVSGTENSARIGTVGLAPGSYTVSASVMEGPRAKQRASCTGSFTIEAPEPPTVSCAPDPSEIMIGATATITAVGGSPQHRPLTYSYSASAGHITGTTTSAVLAADGVDPGIVTVTCGVTDDLGKSATASAAVNVVAPTSAPVKVTEAAPMVSNLCAISFERDRRRPVRVDNEAKACLDDVALQMERDSTGRLVIVGGYSTGEKPRAAEERARNVREYLVAEKGIDGERIELRVGATGTRSTANVFVPAGATYDAGSSEPIKPTNK